MEIKYNNLYTHFVFTTQDRFPAIASTHRERIVSRTPAVSEKELAETIANASEIFINTNHLCVGKFKWQTSCSAFSVSKLAVDKVCKYILNQPEHHKKHTFVEEYALFMQVYQHTLGTNKG